MQSSAVHPQPLDPTSSYGYTLPSPTLTNPDMILPQQTERESSTPSPPFTTLPFDVVEQNGFRSSHERSQDHDSKDMRGAGIGFSLSLQTRMDGGPVASHDTWGYADEQTTPRAQWAAEGEHNGDYHPRGPSDSLGSKAQWQNGTEREEEDCDADSCSVSNSTVSATTEIIEKLQELRRPNQDRESSVGREAVTREDSGDQRQFSGDAPEPVSRMGMGAIAEEDEEGSDGEIPESLLSKEAERILENAKKRLTVRFRYVLRS